jgi:DNA-binding CsgD family transcriptional regulator
MYFLLGPEAGPDVSRLTESQCRLEVDAQGVYLVRSETEEKVRILQTVLSDFDFSKVSSFSNRERQLFELLGEGRSMNEVADRMGVSVKTVETYRARIKVKLDVAGGLHVLRLAMEWKLLYRTTGDTAPANVAG